MFDEAWIQKFSCHNPPSSQLSKKSLFPGNIGVHRWNLRDSLTVSLIYDVGAAAGFVHRREAKPWSERPWLINMPTDDKGKQNELVCDGSSQPRDMEDMDSLADQIPLILIPLD